ncbi:MAG: hypothetical protein N4A47_04245 [Clostridia bacterium]|jgi:hypothetical protein|nr:hypothetical protein [Clostridia bacterium]
MKNLFRGMFKGEFEQKDLEILALKDKHAAMQESLIESNDKVESLMKEVVVLKGKIDSLKNNKNEKYEFKIVRTEYIREENEYTKGIVMYKKHKEGLLMLESFEKVFELEKECLSNLKSELNAEKEELEKSLEEAGAKTDELKSPTRQNVTGEEIYDSVAYEVDIEHKIEEINNKFDKLNVRCELIKLIEGNENYKEDLYEMYIKGNFEEIKLSTNASVI